MTHPAMNPRFSKFFPALVSLLGIVPVSLTAQSSPYRGLWVGDVTLSAVNEVTVPLDAANVPRAPDPNVPTPTFDAANLRLILHVDATGRVSLLKHVAVLARKAGIQQDESDLSLVTDERLYGEFPAQPASRISSVVFDFGDAKATAAVNEVVDRIASAAATAAVLNGATQTSVSTAAANAAAPVIDEADASNNFARFLQEDLNKNQVTAIADGGSTTAARDAALALRNGSFYADTRGIEMVDAIEAAILPAGTQAERRQAAYNTASAFAETDLAYDRFLAGELIGDMIVAAADSAAQTAGTMPLSSITGFAGSGAGTAVTSIAHGLVTGEEIAIQGTALAAYNGLHSIVRINDDSFRIAVPFITGATIAGYSGSTRIAPLRVTSAGHGLTSGDWVTIRGSIPAYDGRHLVTVIDADTFSIGIPYDYDPVPRGVWAVRSGEISGFESTPDGSAPVKVLAPNHGLDNGQTIEIRNSGSASYNGLKTITRIDADSFTIDQAFDGNPTVKGEWDLPVAISEFRPPAVVPTRISSANHRLATGDRIMISGSGNPDYNGQFEVTVLDADFFSIPIDFNTVSGNPAIKGSWQPATGGQWRRTTAVAQALNTVPKVVSARSTAQAIRVTDYSDTRAPVAVETVLTAIVRAASLAGSSLAAEVSSIAAQAGRDALASSVMRYPRPSSPPSEDYNEFVTSSSFTGSVSAAADAAAAAALKEKGNLLATPTSIRDKAMQAAIESLTPVFAMASRTLLTELAMTGSFGPGSSGLETEVVLPANHPTNPFRHRRHPDHTVGFDIRRLVSLAFDSQDAQPSAPAGYGVDRLTGTYNEEIFGLHKPLGPSSDIGLKVRGTFQLNRISRIDTLNGR